MSRIKNIFAVSVGFALLAACSSIDIEKTRKMPSKGTAFQQALHKEYAELAFMEDDEGDSEDAVYFNNKAMMAAAGNKVDPQKIKARKLPGDSKWELDAARRVLVAELLSGAKERMPAKAAHAQAMFDCWMQEKEENDQPKDIARCRSAFDQALNDLGKRPMTAAPAPAPVPGPYVVFFAFDSSKLDGRAMGVIKEASAAARAANISGMVLNGHADRSGANAYNMRLSQARVDAVSKALSGAGVSGASIESSLGEDFPVVATPDGQREDKNRRVDIKFRR